LRQEFNEFSFVNNLQFVDFILRFDIQKLSKMKKLLLLLSIFSLSLSGFGQDLPRWMTEEEKAMMPAYLESISSNRNSTPPPWPVRNMAEWEEAEYLLVTWTSQTAILREIVRHAREEVKVIVICSDSNAVKSNLTQGNVTLSNIQYVKAPFNSIWIRDYFGNTAYKNDVDSMVMIDWVYNRPRPNDNNIPTVIANLLNIPIYKMDTEPNRWVACGGNYMSDGQGIGFSSELILDENANKTIPQIDSLMNSYLGLDTYVKMTKLPYDGIHHIDMHMKLMNEEILLMGEYPTGISDGPQIELNLSYVMDNFNSTFGTPYKVKRVMMPPSPQGTWPNQGAAYRTYANMIFVNKTVLVPIYNMASDEEGLQAIRDVMPGYKVIGINCSAIIPSGGAIHCISHTIGVRDPLLIVHQQLPDTYNITEPYEVNAKIQHKSGIASATLHYRTDTTLAYQTIAMSNTGSDNWRGLIPVQNPGDMVYYYIEGNANSGKKQVRPITAPQGYFKFLIYPTASIENLESQTTFNVFPNPSKGIFNINIKNSIAETMELRIIDMNGKIVKTQNVQLSCGAEWLVSVDAQGLKSGLYQVQLVSKTGIYSQKLMVN
jgi:agmatine/peptidylarginine deiminase